MFQCINTWAGGRRDKAFTRKLIWELELVGGSGWRQPKETRPHSAKVQTVKVLIAGGADYIGSTVASAYLDAGITPVILDNLVTGRPAAWQRTGDSMRATSRTGR